MFIGIVADDLTGAADSVAPFAQQGCSAGVGLAVAETTARECLNAPWDALALNTELRDRNDLKPTLIASIARRATRRLIERSPQIYFKKIDSTLRGHLQPELDGMLRELPGRMALVCPASPANDRSVEHGVLYVGDSPLSATAFGKNNAASNFSTIRAAFGRREDPTAMEIGLSLLRAGSAEVAAELERQFEDGVRTVFCDAVTPDDLRTLAHVVLARPERYLPVGSAGFTRALAECLPARPVPEETLWNPQPFMQGRVLVIVGSRHPVSRRQARRMLEESDIVPMVLARQKGLAALALEQSFRERYYAGERVFLLTTPDVRQSKSARYSIDHALLLMSQWVGNETPFDAYVATGGETAQQLCYALQGTHLRILGESEPGIVRTVLSRANGLPAVQLIVKAGGFGDEATLARCYGGAE
jgi:uncharacterized protein YgbK (DUF1537 family)